MLETEILPGECGRRALPVSASIFRTNALCVLLGIFLLSGCYSPKRDLIQDPVNTPLIHILDSSFDPASGSVTVRWEYLGAAQLFRVVVLRRITGDFDSIGVVTTGTSVGQDRFVNVYSDAGPPAGELLEYSVTARTDVGRVEARAVQVQVPGARLLRLRRNPFQGRIQLDWQAVGNDPNSFEIVRQADGSAMSLVTAGPSETSFVDTEVTGDTPYSYVIRTNVSGGAMLESFPLSAEVYSLERTEVVPNPGQRLALGTGSSSSSATLLALVGRGSFIDVSEYRYFFGVSFDGSQTVGAIREETTSVLLSDVDVTSLSIAGSSVFQPASQGDRAVIAGRNAAGSRVVIQALSLPNLTVAWDGPPDWTISDSNSPVTVSQVGDGNTYVAADGDMRVYTSTNLELERYSLPFDTPTDIDGDNQNLWFVVPSESRVYRADISTGLLPDLTWAPVTLPIANVNPTALTLNRFGQVFVLDGSTRMVHAFDSDMTHLLSWSLPNEDFAQGSLALDGGTGNLVHVSTSSGKIHTYLP